MQGEVGDGLMYTYDEAISIWVFMFEYSETNAETRAISPSLPPSLHQ